MIRSKNCHSNSGRLFKHSQRSLKKQTKQARNKLNWDHSGFPPRLILDTKMMALRVAFWVDRHNCVNKWDVPQLKFHPGTHLDYDFHMPFRCAVLRGPHKSWVHKNLTFFSFPTDPKLKQKWVAALKARTMDYKWQSSHRVCSAHFHGGRRYGTNNIPAVFPRKDNRTGQVVWPVDIC